MIEYISMGEFLCTNFAVDAKTKTEADGKNMKSY